MNVITRIKAITLFVAILAISVSAQTTEFTYQGSLNDGANPANGNYDFEFALFSAVTGGTQAGSTITALNVLVTDGVFSIPLNFGSQFPGTNRFLEIRVRLAGGGAFTALSPRQQLRSAPYSVQSLNAAQLGGVTASQFIQSGAAAINAGSQFEIGGSRIISVGGTSNTFVGVGTGQANSTGGENSFFGNGAGQANNSGNQNSFFGLSAGKVNTTGSTNSFFGATSGDANTTGGENSFFGAASGGSNTAGNQNSIFGRFAGRFNVAGNENALFGYSAGGKLTTSFNSMFGSQAGANTTTGAANAFFGYSSGLVNADGQNNSFFGVNSGLGNTSGSFNTFVGRRAGQANTTGINNTLVGANSGNTNISGSNNTTIGADADVSGTGLSFATAIGAGATVSTSDTIVIGRTTDTVKVRNVLEVFELNVSDTAYINVGTGGSGILDLCIDPGSHRILLCSSSAKYKKNINQFNRGLDLIKRLRPVTFGWKSTDEQDIGLIAEEVNEVEPLLALRNSKGEIEGVKYKQISVVLVNAVKEQEAQIEALEKKDQSQQEQIAVQQRQIDLLTKIVCSQKKNAEVCKAAAAPK